MRKEFSNANKKEKKGGIDELLPKNAVKVGETWNIDPAALKSFTGDDSFPIDAAKSKLTGKLAKTYVKDGNSGGSSSSTWISLSTRTRRRDKAQPPAP